MPAPRQTTPWPLSQIQPFLDYLSIECGLAQNTIIAYRHDLNRFHGYCDCHAIDHPDQVTPLLVQRYARFLSIASLSSATIARHLVALRMFLRYHTLLGLMQGDICSVLETPKTWQRLPRVISAEQTLSLIDAADADSTFYLRDRALLELLYATGMRASEIANLQLKDVNFQVGFLRCIGKGNKERIIPVHHRALQNLREYIENLRPLLVREKDTTTVFASRTGNPLGRIEVWRIVKRAALRAGLSGRVTPHTLRHCFGSHLLQGGADLRCVQEMLGHADVTTTQIYTHVDQQHLRNIHKKYHPMA